MPALQIRNLSKTYEYSTGFWHRSKVRSEAVKNISFTIEEGEFVGFIGPNGAGKTTTLKMLSGILYPSSGEARVLGFVPWQRKPQFHKQIALVMGNKNQLWWELPAQDSFILNKEIYELSDSQFQKNVKELTTLLNIVHLVQVPVRKLSLGERMKAELVAALLHEPKVLFLDEPTIGLDVVSQKALRDFLVDWNQRKHTTILLTSHYMEDIKALTERVITIDHGQIIYDGRLDDLIKKFVAEKVLKITFKNGEVSRLALEGYGKIHSLEKDYAELIVSRPKITEVTKEILDRFPVDDLLVEEVKIEEVVRRIFEKGQA